MTLGDLLNDQTFKANWPYCARRLKEYLLTKQQDYAAKRPDNYDEVGRYVHFMSTLFNELEQVEHAMSGTPPAPRKRLTNAVFEAPPPRPVTPTPAPHANGTTTRT